MTDEEIKNISEEIKDLNYDIANFEVEYWNKRRTLMQKRARLLLETDWAEVIGKAKPTVAEKDAYIDKQLADDQFHYRVLRTRIDCKKRLFQIMLKELGDE